MKKTAIWHWIFAALLALGTATFAAADDHGSDSGKHGSDDAGSSTTVNSGSTSSSQPEPGDDKGNSAQPGDDKGNGAEPGDDKGGQTSAVSSSSPTSDDKGGGEDIRIRRKLIPTGAGLSADASGHFVIRMRGTRQRFQVEAEAMVPNGTILMVFADNNLVGSLTIQMGEDELQLDSEDGDLPEGLDPVKAIKTVTVTDANGTVILQGQV